MGAMEYRGYRSAVHYSAEDRLLRSPILGIEDMANFEGTDVDELEQTFHEAVDDYLAPCGKLATR